MSPPREQGAPGPSSKPFVSPFIVHSHLRWDFVWQRPQQLFSRIAATHPVLFVEEPIETDGAAALDVTVTPEGVVRAIPRLPSARSMTVDAQCAATLPLLEAALRGHPALAGRFDAPIQWFYSPMTAPCYLDRFGAVGTVYDCMDELSGFRFAPPDLGEREDVLLAAADVVFTGGYELYRAKSARHPDTHFYGCGVDAEHFARARAAATAVPADLAELPRPVVGYYGVIDERLDYELLESLAADLPAASVVMVGPLAKVAEADLPRAPNLHWLGSRRYADLPSIVKAFDVCLMPFAMNAATRYINPTKTLEYLAAGKPVVSTAVPDVVRQFADIVDVADSKAAFLASVRARLRAVDPRRLADGIARAQASSWEAIVRAMRGHVARALDERATRRATEEAHA
jgi:glycosyltransferase involved in cell wall biosynthesis